MDGGMGMDPGMAEMGGRGGEMMGGEFGGEMMGGREGMGMDGAASDAELFNNRYVDAAGAPMPSTGTGARRLW